MTHLLDVNVLLAAIWQSHEDHPRTFAWLAGKTVAVCPIGELGFLRISTNVRAIGAPMADARALLKKFLTDRQAGRIADDLPALDSQPATSAQVTDHYLADLAAKHGCKLATLDGGIKHPAADVVS